MMTFTYTKDVAKFVVEALSLPTWGRNTYVIGDKMTWEEFVKVAEEARGGTRLHSHIFDKAIQTANHRVCTGEKFTVTYDSVEKLKAGQITELPGQVAAYSSFPKEWMQKLFSVFGFWVTEGIFDFPEEKALNEVFPHVQVTTVRDMLQNAWQGHQLNTGTAVIGI